MVKLDTHATDANTWLAHLATSRRDEDILHLNQAIAVYEPTKALQLAKGLAIADILFSLGLDTETLSAALLYPAMLEGTIDTEFVLQHFGESCNKLLHDILQMRSFSNLQTLQSKNNQQLENLRKMLLAMIADVRAVLVIIAERLYELRQAKNLSQDAQKKLAEETMNVYAPLANRLGVWQLKWEIEDLCLRYTQPEIYQTIAKSLTSRRLEREKYIQQMIALLTETLHKAHIKNVQVTGRVKHIYSIYAKMQRKHANFEQIFDISAMRVLVDSVDDCYQVLSILQNHWQQIQEEFDDYISQPKPNGYRSIHTVIIGPDNKPVEVQIRTQQMHQESELGVAAHWRYKEGVLQVSSYEAKIALLRQVMEWQKELTTDIKSDKPIDDLFADRVYVFTPTGDIIDMPTGATPLDFAYHIHSEVGHRCRGAKVDGNMVPLTYPLKTGQRVEILTAKHSNPSRDWLNPQYGYLMTARARAKAAHWFRVLDAENIAHEIPREKPVQPLPPLTPVISPVSKSASTIQVSGIDNLLTKIALCCKPLPGDAVLGFVTQHRGVTIHRRNCKNALRMIANNHERVIDVSWNESKLSVYAVDLQLNVVNRTDILRDITSFLSTEKINIIALKTQASLEGQDTIYLTIEIANMAELQKTTEKLQHIPSVLSVRRH